MEALDIGPLAVCEGKRVVGMLTDRDITVRATAAGCDPKTTLVGDAMTQDHPATQVHAELKARPP